MILLDDRTGSGDLSHFLNSWGVAYDLCRLPFGDAAMAGQAPYGDIGVEIKKTRDALQCMCDGRFAGHQLPGLISSYNLVWFVIEGSFGVDFESGILTTSSKGGKRCPLTLGKRQFHYKEFDHWLMTMEIKGGMKIKRTTSRTETARFLVDLMTWWEKPLDKHRSHLAFHETRPDAALLVPPTLVRKVAAQLPGIGWVRSGPVAQRFNTVQDMCNASEAEWLEVDGIGKGIAKMLVQSLSGRR